MLIETLLNLVKSLLSTLLVFDLPSMPDSVETYMSTALGYITSGIGYLTVFFGSTAMIYLGVLLKVVLAIEAAYLVYRILMWILKKIPFFGISE